MLETFVGPAPWTRNLNRSCTIVLHRPDVSSFWVANPRY